MLELRTGVQGCVMVVDGEEWKVAALNRATKTFGELRGFKGKAATPGRSIFRRVNCNRDREIRWLNWHDCMDRF